MITAKDLIYKHFEYQQLVLEGYTDADYIKQAYDKWASFSIITTITPKYIRVALPDKKQGQHTVSHYADHKVLQGLWLACSSYGADTEEYVWCKNRVMVIIHRLLFRARASAPYLINTIKL